MQNQVQDAPWASLDNMTDEEQSLDMWGFLQRRKSFVILLAIVGAGLGYLYFQRQIPQFKSSALLQVIHHNSDPRVENLLAERNLSDAQHVVTSETLLQSCFDRHNLKDLETLRGFSTDVAIKKIASMVSANSQASNILLLSCQGPNANDTAVIANAVSAEFMAHQEESYADAVGDLQDLLEKAHGQLHGSLDALEKDYELFDNDSQLNSDGENPHRQQIISIQSKKNTLVIEQTEVKAELLALQEALEKGGQRDALMMLIGKKEAETGNRTGKRSEVEEAVANAKTLFQSILPLLMEEAILSEELGAGHPKLLALRKRIELTQMYQERLAGMTVKPTEDGTPKPRVDLLAVYMNSLRQELNVLDKQRLELETLSTQAEEAAKALRSEVHERASFERRIARETSLLEDVQAQIRATELPTNFGGVTASTLTEASHGIHVYPSLTQFVGMGAFLGAFMGLALGYVVEIADRSFRKPEEIIREFGVPILGHIPYMQEQKLKRIPNDTVMDRTVISLHQPRSRPAEAYRSVRTAVCFSALGSKHRVIQVTSPAAGDGKSTLTMNFAVSLAQSGKKTIIIESDFRRPKVHKLTGVDNSIGLVDVLRGDAELTDAICETELEGFYVMPCGSRPRNPSELITRPEYEQVLEALREKFEYVIIDTPPVLVVTDPCSVAPRVDGVLLCVRLSRHTRDFGRRALEQLRDVGANMTGIVVNGVEESDAYGYGSYSYTDYRYRYNDYSYSDSYGNKANEAYFADSESEMEEVATKS